MAPILARATERTMNSSIIVEIFEPCKKAENKFIETRKFTISYNVKIL